MGGQRTIRLTGLTVTAVHLLEGGVGMNEIRERTGVYGLGFRRESVMGLIVPIAFVVFVGGLGAALILFSR